MKICYFIYIHNNLFIYKFVTIFYNHISNCHEVLEAYPIWIIFLVHKLFLDPLLRISTIFLYFKGLLYSDHFCLVHLDVIPVGADLVKIWGVEAELFLMIDDQGQMRGTVSLHTF